jgi:hypothetical protein
MPKINPSTFENTRGVNRRQTYGLSSEGLYEDLHTTTKAKYQVKGRFFLDVVIRKSPSVFELLSSENETLLIRRDTFLVLNLGFDVVNGIGGLDFESDLVNNGK